MNESKHRARSDKRELTVMTFMDPALMLRAGPFVIARIIGPRLGGCKRRTLTLKMILVLVDISVRDFLIIDWLIQTYVLICLKKKYHILLHKGQDFQIRPNPTGLMT